MTFTHQNGRILNRAAGKLLMVMGGNPNDRISASQERIAALALGAIQAIRTHGTDPEMLNSRCHGQGKRHTVGEPSAGEALAAITTSVAARARKASSARPPRPTAAVAQAQGLRWLLDDLLDAEPELRALLASPSGLPTSQRQRLAAFCAGIGAALNAAPDRPGPPLAGSDG